MYGSNTRATIGDRLNREGLVGLDEVVVANAGAGLCHQVVDRSDGGEEQITRLSPARGIRGDARHGRDAVRLRERERGDDQRTRAIVEPGRIPCGDRSFLLESRLELGECLRTRVLPGTFVVCQGRWTAFAGNLHRQNLILEPAGFLSGYRLAMAVVGERVLIGSGDPCLLRGVFRVFTHVTAAERVP